MIVKTTIPQSQLSTTYNSFPVFSSQKQCGHLPTSGKCPHCFIQYLTSVLQFCTSDPYFSEFASLLALRITLRLIGIVISRTALRRATVPLPRNHCPRRRFLWRLLQVARSRRQCSPIHVQSLPEMPQMLRQVHFNNVAVSSCSENAAAFRFS